MSESQDYGTVARYFMDSLPGTGKRATKYDQGPFFTVYKGDFRGAWTSYYDDVAKIKEHNDRKGIKPSFCKAYTWTEVEFVVEHMTSFKEIIWRYGNGRLEEVLIDTFGTWDNVHIGKELREEINKHTNPLQPAPNELASTSPQRSSQPSGLSLSQPPPVRTPTSSQSFSPTRPPPSSQSTPSRTSSKRPLFASPSSSESDRNAPMPMRKVAGKRLQVIEDDIATATSILWTPRSLSMGSTYQLALIDSLVDELTSLRHHFASQFGQVTQTAHALQGSPAPKTAQNLQVIEDNYEDVSEAEHGDDNEEETRNSRAGSSFRRVTRPCHC